MSPKTLSIVLAFAAILALNTACAEQAEDSAAVANEEAAEAVAGETSPAPVDNEKGVETTEEAAERWTEAMRNIPVDGSSLAAFEGSLEKIKERAKESEYTTLTNAIDYLMIYDLAAKRDRAKLAANLDGMTGAEIVDKVYWRKGNKYRGKSSD